MLIGLEKAVYDAAHARDDINYGQNIQRLLGLE